MARDVQCKHVSNLHVILHNRHQQLGSHRIMLSVGAEKALPTLGHADCTMHPVVLDDDPLDSLAARTSADPSSNGWALHATHKVEVHNLFSQVLVIGTVTGRLCLHCPFTSILYHKIRFGFVLFCFHFFVLPGDTLGHYTWDIIPASHHKEFTGTCPWSFLRETNRPKWLNIKI